MESESTRLLSATYADALTVLEPRILALSEQIAAAQAAGETVNLSWLFQQERYQELRRQLLTLMDQYGEATKLITTEAQKVIVRESLQHAGQTLLSVSGGSGDEIATLARGWASVPDESIINLVGAMQSGTPLDATIQSYGVDAVQDVQQALTRGLALGDSAQMTTQVIRALGVTRARAESLTRTEIMRASRAATTAAYIQSGVVEKVRWSAALSSRTCGYCLSRHGKTYPLGTVMESHPNCFPAGTLCSGPEVVGSSVRWYVGDLVDIRFASGDHISVTPNHPILTPHGWVAAGLLNEGSSVVRSSLSERELAAVYPDYQDGPALIEQVAETLGGNGLVESISVPTAPEDFHGDGFGSDVSVIRANRLLGDGVNSTISEPSLHDEFRWRRMQLAVFSGLGGFLQSLNRTALSAHSVVGFCRECLALLGGGFGHPGIHSFGAVAGCYTSGNQALANAGSADFVGTGQRLFGLTTQVPSHHLIHGKAVTLSTDHPDLANPGRFAFLEVSQQTSFTQNTNEPGGVGMESLSSDLRTLAGKIGIDRILEVSVRSFRGHVYNLETKDGYYIANGIIVHNCRCSWSPYNPKWSDDWQSGESWLKEQPLTVQQDILGKLGAADFNAGNLQLADFEKTGFDKDWGPTGHFGGVEWARKQATKAGRAPSEWAAAPPITRTRKVTKPKPDPKRTAPIPPANAPARGRSLEGEAFIEFQLDV